MTTIYQRLAPLGFAEWLAKQLEQSLEETLDDINSLISKQDVSSVHFTSLNALAFRWLREEKGIDCEPTNSKSKYTFIAYVAYENMYVLCDEYLSYELASIACLEKAAEIIESNK